MTTEDTRKDALREIAHDPKLVQMGGEQFDEIVKRIIGKNVKIKQRPGQTKVCKECDFRFYCKIQEA